MYSLIRLHVYSILLTGAFILTGCGGGSGSTGGTPATVLAATFTEMEVVQASGAGGIAGDSNGVTITVDNGAVPNGNPVRLIASVASGNLINEIAKYYGIESPYYSVNIEGGEDAPGRVLLQFPVSDIASRLAIIIDEQHFSLLPFEPENGKLNVQLVLSPELSPAESGLNVRTDDSIHVVVVNPRPLVQGQSSKGLRQSAATVEPDFCTNTGQFHQCFDASRKIQVNWNTNFNTLSAQSAGVILGEVQRALNAYKIAGFANADIPFWSWINIQLEPGRSDGAEFSSNNGTIYIGTDTVTTVADSSGDLHLTPKARLNLWHELFHYIQDFSYNMKFSRLLERRSWWLEVTGENAPFLVDPDLIGESARVTGSVTNVDGGPYGIQMAPFTWQAGSAGYIHAQLLKVNTCENSLNCALTSQGYADAINNGVFPFQSTTKMSELLGTRPMEDYMRYLLGALPVTTNTTIPIADHIANGTSIGDQIFARQSPVGSDKFQLNPTETYFTPRITRVGNTEINIAAEIGPGAAYHCRISNDSMPPTFQTPRAGVTTWPLTLTVNAPYPVMYRTGSTDAQGVTNYNAIEAHNGSADLVIAPIHQDMGISVVRIAANNNSTSLSKTLTATVEVVDLSGYWESAINAVTVDSVQCLDTTVVIPEREQFINDFFVFSGSTGIYEKQPAPNPNKLSYMLNSSTTMPAKTSQSGNVTIKSDVIEKISSVTFEDRIINNILYENAVLNTTLQLDTLVYTNSQNLTDPVWIMTGTGETAFNASIQGRNSQGINVATLCSGSIQYTTSVGVYSNPANFSPVFPGEPLNGSFTVTFYSNFDGAIGGALPIDPAIPDIKIYGNTQWPMISWNRSDAVAVLVANNNIQQILYHILGTDDENDEFVYIQPALQYGDYNREFTFRNINALNPSPALLDDGTEYVITINTGSQAQPHAVLGFRVNPP